MKLSDIFTDSKTYVFTITDQSDDNELNWIIKPTSHKLIPEEENNYLVRAFEVTESGTKPCFIEIITPERIAETVILKDNKGQVSVQSIFDRNNSIIPAIASECLGDHDLYYAEENAEIGINVLREGLEKATNKNIVAEDLGYLLADEGLLEEAIEAFKISEEFGPTSEYIYLEIADLYAELEDVENQNIYLQKYKDNGGKEA